MRTAVVAILVLALVGLAYWMLGTDDGTPGGGATLVEPVAQPGTGVMDDPVVAPRTEATVERLDGGAPPRGRTDDDGLPPMELYDDVTAIGIVTYADDTPAEDIEVTLVDSLGELWDFSSTDEFGRFQLAAGDALAPGWAVFTEQTHYEEPEALDAYVPDFAVHPTAHAPGDPPVSFHLRLLGAPRVRGRVTDKRTGRPIDAAEVYLATARPGFVDEWQDFWTEQDGLYDMAVVNMPAEDLLLWCVSEDHAPRSYGPLDLEPGQIAIYDFELEPSQVVTGVVLDDRTLNPVDGADVQAIPLHPDMADDDAWDMTLDDGTFELSIYSTPLDALWLHVYAEDHAPVAIRPLDPRVPLEIRLGPPQTLVGRAFDAVTREPVGGVELVLQMLTPTDMLLLDYSDEAWLEDDGHFELVPEYVPLSHAWVEVLAEGYYPLTVPLRTLGPSETSIGTFEVQLPLDPLQPPEPDEPDGADDGEG